MIKYNNIRQIIESLNLNRDCGIREKAFDWQEIGTKDLLNRHRIINICKRYGKVQRHFQGFSVRFTDV